MPAKQSRSLFFKTAITLSLPMLLISLLIFITAIAFVVVPIARQSADDLAALLKLSAQTWVKLPRAEKLKFKQELLTSNRLIVQDANFELKALSFKRPYISFFLHSAMEQQIGKIEFVGENRAKDYKNWIWIDILIDHEIVRFGILIDRIGISHPAIFIFSFFTILLLTLITALVLAKKLSQPLSQLSKATTLIGKGKKYNLPSISGASELIQLYDNFHEMSQEVQKLLKNRTVLLAGISHDLRTPLTRLKLAIELLPLDIDKTTISEMISDIDAMENLLHQALGIARNLEEIEPFETINLETLISQIIAPYQLNHPEIYYIETNSVIATIPPNTFKRVFTNLLDNSIHYGLDKPIEINIRSEVSKITISIYDEGSGVPESECEQVFQPFYRLENSRSIATGGSGLGLAIVKQLCSTYGWSIHLLPTDKGGTEARLTLST